MDSAALSGNDQHKSINAQDPASASVTQASTNDTTLPYSDSLNHPASAALAPSESQNTAAYDAKHSGQGAATGGVSSRQDFEGQRFNSPAASVDRTDSVVATPPLPSARQSPSDASQHQERHLQEDATSSLSATGAKGVFDHSADVRSTTNAELPSTSALTADAPSMGSAAPHVSEQQQPNPIQPSARIPGGAGGQDPSVNSDPSFSTQPSSAAFARPAQPTSSSDSMLTSRPRESPLAASSSRRDAGSFSAAGTSATSLAKPSRSSEISPVPVFPGMPVPNAASVGQQTALVHTSAPPVDSRALQVQAQRERERARALDREQRERERERDMHREAEEARLIWLSLAGNDHPQYYSDTDQEYSSDYSDLSPPPPRVRHPYVSPPRNLPSSSRNGLPSVPPSATGLNLVPDHQRSKPSGLFPEDEVEYHALASNGHGHSLQHANIADDFAPVSWHSEEEDDRENGGLSRKERYGNRTGNRGNKLKRKEGARWVRRTKLGGWTEARTEKEMHDRLRVRIAALQRAGVRSLLNAAPLPHPALSAPPEFSTGPSHLIDSDMPGLTSVALAPTLLRPVLSPLALLQSHTLKHTFRNPHIAALGKTALDLRESESAVGRALGRAFSAMERVEDEQQFALEQAQEAESMAQEYDESAEGEDLEMKANGRSKVDGSVQDGMAIDDEAGEGMTSSALLGDPDPLAPTSAPGLDPAFARLNALFITPGGLSIPMPGSQSSDSLSSSQGQQAHAVLTPVQQRDVVRAALECLNELAGDSREYVERLDEVRSRLAAVKRRRAQVWEALRLWALQREEEEDERERQANERAPVAA